MTRRDFPYLDFGKKSLVVEHNRTKGHYMGWRHLHSQYEILFVKEGSVVVDSNATTFRINTPSLIVHKPFYLHCANAPEGELYDRYIINIADEWMVKIKDLIPNFSLFSSATTTVIPFSEAMTASITSDFDSILCAYQNHKEERALLEIALMLLKVTEYAHDKGVPLSEKNHYISDVIRYISLHYAEDIKIDPLADLFYISRSKLISDFKKCIGVTIKKYIMFVRISNAQYYLNTGSSISETASLCGFYDNSHFISTFRLITGMTPKEFIKKKPN